MAFLVKNKLIDFLFVILFLLISPLINAEKEV